MTDSRWWLNQSLWRFLIVGVTVTAVDFGVLALLHGLLAVNVVASAVIAFLTSFVVNFTLSRQWTFQSTQARASTQLIKFCSLVAVNTVATAAGMWLLTSSGVQYLVAKLMLTAVIFCFNYVIMRRWIFPAALPGPGAAREADRPLVADQRHCDERPMSAD